MRLFPDGQPPNVTLLSPEADVVKYISTHYSGFNLAELLFDLERVAERWGFDWSRILINLTLAQNLRIEHLHDQESKEESLTMTRALLDPMKQARRCLYHRELFIPAKWQGQGLAGKLLGPYYRQCQRAQVHCLKVQASASAGGYAWARYGFAATQLADVRGILEGAEARGVPASAVAMLRTDLQTFYALHPLDTPFSMRPWAELPFARQLLAGTTWHGELDLSNPRQIFFFESYLWPRPVV